MQKCDADNLLIENNKILLDNRKIANVFNKIIILCYKFFGDWLKIIIIFPRQIQNFSIQNQKNMNNQ